jgi:penicillin-binding protein 1C
MRWLTVLRGVIRRVRARARARLTSTVRAWALVLGALALAGAPLYVASSFPMQPARDLDPARHMPLRVLDRHGALLRSVPSSERPGRGAWVSLERVSASAVQTLLAGEDQRFFEHGGVDGWSVLRALWLDLRAFGPRYGASTLSMQLARMAYPREIQRSWLGKLRQLRAAWAIEAALDKRAILEQYLNRAYFGHGAYGIEAAAQTYFQRSAQSLSPGQACLLMVLPRGPATYDPARHLARALKRRDHLLTLLVAQQRITPDAATRVRAEPLALALREPDFEAGHFVDWVLSELPGERAARGGGLQTTLDLSLQRALEHRTREHLAALRARDADQAGVVVLETGTGAVLAMVGSRKYGDARAGQLNIATWRRYPGSALKPFVYAAAIERGDSPASIAYDVYDVPSSYVITGMVPEEHGPARYREALAGSYNLAAIHVLERVGLEPVMDLLMRAGAAELAQRPNDYGLRLSLGATKVRLVDIASAYGAFVRGGVAVPAHGVLGQNAASRRVLSPETAWLVMDMLADPDARRPRFGPDLPFDLPYRVAAKTGTARGFSDTVAIVTTRELTVAAWTGRFDGAPTQGLSGMRGAAELARAALLVASGGRALSLPERPPGITPIAVCPLSGKLPGPHCLHRKRDYAASDALPRDLCDLHGPGGRVHYPAELRGWLKRSGRAAGPLSMALVPSARD